MIGKRDYAAWKWPSRPRKPFAAGLIWECYRPIRARSDVPAGAIPASLPAGRGGFRWATMAPPDPLGLPARDLEKYLTATLEGGGDYADVFCEHGRSHSLTLEEGRVKTCSSDVAQGVAFRVIAGEAQGQAFAEVLDGAELLRAARLAGGIARGGGAPAPLPALDAVSVPDRYRVVRSPTAADIAERIALLRRGHAAASAGDPRVVWVTVSLSDSERWITVADSDGHLARDYRPMVTYRVNVVLRDGERTERGGASLSMRRGLELFDERPPEDVAVRALEVAQLRMRAEPCPAGTMPVVLAPGSSGVLIHEAVGHGLEADFNRKGVSAYSGRIGEPVASELVTIVDEGLPPGNRGSLNVDDEGASVGSTTLIENGRLVAYMHDRMSSRCMGLPETGNGRRESYRAPVIPRMRVTRLDAGGGDPEEIVASVDRGLYAKTLGGGSVDITKGDYNFEVAEAWLIENGKLTRPVRGATLVGNGPETMRRVEAVGNDLEISEEGWMCGKDGQGAPVGVGLPTTLIGELTVGGTA